MISLPLAAPLPCSCSWSGGFVTALKVEQVVSLRLILEIDSTNSRGTESLNMYSRLVIMYLKSEFIFCTAEFVKVVLK